MLQEILRHVKNLDIQSNESLKKEVEISMEEATLAYIAASKCLQDISRVCPTFEIHDDEMRCYLVIFADICCNCVYTRV